MSTYEVSLDVFREGCMRFQKIQKNSVSVIVIVLYMLMLCGNTSGADLTVKLMLNLEDTTISEGSDPIALTAVTRGVNVQITWKLVGPGHIEGTGIAVVYIVPDQIKEESADVVITVMAKDETGREVTDAVTLTILPAPDGQSPSIDELGPDDISSKKGMKTSTKFALGAGAIALVGGGIALAAKDGNSNDDAVPSLSGIWHGIINFKDDAGNPLDINIRLSLNQKGKEITGYGDIEMLAIEFVTGTYTYPNINLTLQAFGHLPMYLVGSVTDKGTIVGITNGSGFENCPVTLKRQ
jgi:hypothetical protein